MNEKAILPWPDDISPVRPWIFIIGIPIKITVDKILIIV